MNNTSENSVLVNLSNDRVVDYGEPVEFGLYKRNNSPVVEQMLISKSEVGSFGSSSSHSLSSSVDSHMLELRKRAEAY